MLRLLAILALLLPIRAMSAEPAEKPDPYIWLEDVNGAKPMQWVRQQNAITLARLQADPHYQPFYDTALALAQASDRIPLPRLIGGQVYNLWQDANHVQGIWRRATLASYRLAAPHWTTVLDLDALGRAEGRRWVFKHADCLEPEEDLCLLSLSDGGEDAVTTREFSLRTAKFVEGGFIIPRSKMVTGWLDRDTLILGTDWAQAGGAQAGTGASMTDSGYPYVIKRLKRGQSLAQATELFRGTRQDVAVQPATYADGQGHHAVILQRGLDFFRSEFRLVQGDTTLKLNLPQKATLAGLLDNRLIVILNQAYAALPSGSLAALDLANPTAAPQLIFAPGSRQSVDDAATTSTQVIAAVYDNIRGRAMAFAPTKAGWAATTLDLPDNASITLADTNPHDDRAFIGVIGFLQPNALYLADLARQAAPTLIKSLAPKFDAGPETIDQYEATSTDGTKIPYFVVHPKTMQPTGANPTLLYAYGGFQVSMTPTYSPGLGKLWLEHGGVYVLANIRGGGEFGPAWHEAGLKTNRQRIYDDFAAVAKDLFARKITSPAHLGIRGGSNGGLLMGVQFTQHPELWKAVIIDVPLLDMLRYEQIAAGASWVGEYGSVKNPDERRFLAKISPYNNIKPNTAYPEPFIFTTTKDDRVGPVHARKFAARLAEMHIPYLYYEATEGGHAAGANLKQIAQEQALEMTYLTAKLMPPG